MGRYEGNDRTPRSKSRRIMKRRRGELNRSAKDNPKDTSTYTGYAHGKGGAS